LTADAERLREDGADMKERLTKLPELEKHITEFVKEKATLVEQVAKVTTELNEAKKNCSVLNKELVALNDTFEEAKNDNDTLKKQNSDLVTKVDELKANQAATPVGGARTMDKDKAVLEASIKNLEGNNAELRQALQEWTVLAKVCVLSN
jgi:predicted nuclease with TOPRIM domain